MKNTQIYGILLLCRIRIATDITSSGTFDIALTSDGGGGGGGVTPLLTFYGSAGSSTLDYMSSGRAVAWSINVTPTSILPLDFAGEISIYTQSTGNYRGTAYVSGYGLGQTSGVAYLPISGYSLTKGVMYRAEFSGTAVNSAGQVFTVVSGASIPFMYN